jgi:serine/threonine-protein kinase
MVEGTPFGRYRLVELLGSGGMGEVWRAYDTGTDRVVALKVLPPHLAQDPAFEQRFRREAHAAARLHNPHIVPIHDYGEIDGRLFVDMRLIEGRDLQAVLTDGPLEPAKAVAVVEQVAGALQSAHKAGLIHRDVKPPNILLDEDDYAYLIDFGIARAAAETRLTSTGATLGTWAYMAPERFTSDRVESSCDIYALACVLHECLTGTKPFPGESLERQFTGHVTVPPPHPSALRAGIPAALDDVIATGMAKDPDQRYGTTKELARAARAALSGSLPPPGQSPVAAAIQPPTMPANLEMAARTMTAPQPPPRRRRAAVAVVAVTLAILLMSAITFAVSQYMRPKPHDVVTKAEWQPFIDAGAQTLATMYTFNQDTIDQSIDRFYSKTTGSLREMWSADNHIANLKALLHSTGNSSEAAVNASGLEYVDGTTGKVLVALTVTQRASDGTSKPPTRLRWRVTVVQTNGTYLISDMKYPDGGA